MVENSLPEKTDTPTFQEIVLNEVLVQGKDVIQKFNIGCRKIVFETTLRRAVEMAEILRIIEGYVRSNIFKKYKPKRKDPSQTKNRKSAESPNIHVFSVEEPESKRRKGTSPGRAVYECHCHRPRQEEVRIKRLAEGKTIKRKRNSIGRGCHAKITIRFAEGYTQEKKGEINVAGFGDSKVTVTWVYDHTHTDLLPSNQQRTKRLRELLSAVVKPDNGSIVTLFKTQD